MKWEYMVRKYGDDVREDFLTVGDPTVNSLNLLGNDGWELVVYHPSGPKTRPIAIFKRPKNQE